MTAAAASTRPDLAIRRRRRLLPGRPERRRTRPAARLEHDLWDFTDVVGLPVEMSLANRRFDFSAITDPR